MLTYNLGIDTENESDSQSKKAMTCKSSFDFLLWNGKNRLWEFIFFLSWPWKKTLLYIFITLFCSHSIRDMWSTSNYFKLLSLAREIFSNCVCILYLNRVIYLSNYENIMIYYSSIFANWYKIWYYSKTVLLFQ